MTIPPQKLYSFNLASLAEPQRLKDFLRLQFPELSSREIVMLTNNNLITRNEDTLTDLDFILTPTGMLFVDLRHGTRGAQAPKRKPLRDQLEVLHDDEECVVVNKASGVVVQPTDGEAKERASGPPLVELLKHYWKRKHAPVVNPYVIQRLDKGTSGVMVLGKTVHAQRFLQRQASDRLMERRYLALVHGNMTRDSGTWRTYLGLDESNRRRSVIRLRDDQPLLTEYPEDVKLAITHFKVMERYPRATLLELRLETGRTHQIRIHCAETAHPLIGDGVYIHLAQHLFPNIKFEEGIPRAPRMMLHAAHLKFQHPGREGRWLTFRAEMPEPMVLFQELLQSPRLRKPQ